MNRKMEPARPNGWPRSLNSHFPVYRYQTIPEIFNSNIKIAYKIAQQYKNCGIECEDLKQMCLLGLWKATITYKNDKGIAFSTYSYRVIQNELNHYLRNNRKYFTNKYFSEEIGENITLEDAIADKHNKIEELENKLDNDLYINKIKTSPLKINERKTFELYLKGYKQDKIAKIIGCSQPQISRYIKKLKKNLEGNYE